MYRHYDVAIIGGGASGMIAAITASANNSELRVVVLEKSNRVGKKLLSTGNGRCNLTNLDQSPVHYHGKNSWFINEVLKQFSLENTLAFFKSIGVETITEGNKVFPRSLQASSVLDLLRYRMKEQGVEEVCDFYCTDIKKEGVTFTVESKDGQVIHANSVLIAAGGKASPNLGGTEEGYHLLGRFGHHTTALFPALVQVCVPFKKTLPLKGIKVQATVSAYDGNVFLQQETGEVLFTEYGLSGPPIFQLSRFVSQTPGSLSFSLDLFPEYDNDTLEYMLTSRKGFLPENMILSGLLHNTVGREILRELGKDVLDLKCLVRLLKNWTFKISGTRGWAQAQVTCGGVNLNDFSPLTLESKLVKGLYACGEVLDADGDCGGYNLQWAWSSGVVAGRALSKG